MVLRRARGYAPLPIAVGPHQSRNQRVAGKGLVRTRATSTRRSSERGRWSDRVLAVGAHLKNSVALKIDNNIFTSQHIGDLETKEAYAAFHRTCADLPRLYDATIDVVACDMHPDYLSTKECNDLTGKSGSLLPATNGVKLVSASSML